MLTHLDKSILAQPLVLISSFSHARSRAYIVWKKPGVLFLAALPSAHIQAPLLPHFQPSTSYFKALSSLSRSFSHVYCLFTSLSNPCITASSSRDIPSNGSLTLAYTPLYSILMSRRSICYPHKYMPSTPASHHTFLFTPPFHLQLQLQLSRSPCDVT